MEPTPRKPLRLWPGVLVAVIVVLLRFVVPVFVQDAAILGVLAAAAGLALIIVWWLFFSRSQWSERIAAIVLMVVATVATWFLVHPSIAGGLMGRMLPVYAVPSTLGPAFVAWAVATRRLPDRIRWATMVGTIVLACGFWTLVRTDGIRGEAVAQWAWRWAPTPEERLLARGDDEPKPVPPAQATTEIPREPLAPKSGEETPGATRGKPVDAARGEAAPAAVKTPAPDASIATAKYDWPGFRGRERDSVIRDVRIETDWARRPPVELWRRPIGPGWSSFAVHGDYIYTQEQRGEQEVVSCYRLTTGEPVWRHRDAVRFYESNGGPGPRGTPTLHAGRVYTQGATGIVNALDAGTGAVRWSRNAATDTGAPLPGWGFAGSPLVVDDAVIVAASGRLAAYDTATGNLRWSRKTGGGGYSSPHLATIDGLSQILLLSGGGVTSVAPSDGSVLWQHSWVEGVGIVQPAFASNGDLLITAGDMMGGVGMRRIAIAHAPAGWNVEERWTSRGLKPYFNDFVVHKGYAFGFDGSILSCIDLSDGQRKWKGGRYGSGQLVLLPDEDLLLVLSEEGELALVKATSDQFTEVARFKAIEGKTWNHPVLVGDVLLVRNGEEMAAFRLSLAGQ
jgi:outer membrane protein assembly factor BamB